MSSRHCPGGERLLPEGGMAVIYISRPTEPVLIGESSRWVQANALARGIGAAASGRPVAAPE